MQDIFARAIVTDKCCSCLAPQNGSLRGKIED